MESAFEVARLIGYLLLVPGLVIRAMFLFNRCLYMDTVINISLSFFYFALTTPSLIYVIRNNNDPLFLIPATVVIFALSIIVAIANAIDIYRAIQYTKREKAVDEYGN